MARRIVVMLTAALAAGPAWAAEDAAHGESFFNAEFFVAVAFILFLGFFGRMIWRAMVTGLDDRSAQIAAELDEAQRLREEAQNLLAEYQRKQRDAVGEAEAILEAARAEARRIEDAAAERTVSTLERRERQAVDMIAQAEAQAVAQVRDMAVDVAVSATERLLADAVDGAKGNELIDDAIDDLPDRLH